LEQGEPGEYEPDLEEFLLNQPSVAPKLRGTWLNSYGAFNRRIENLTDHGKIVMMVDPRNGTGKPKHEAQEQSLSNI
jgi:hypothetical protein